MWEITWWIHVRIYILFFKKPKHELWHLLVVRWTPPESLWTVNERVSGTLIWYDQILKHQVCWSVKASLAVLESTTNSTLSICMSRNHSITLNKPKASPKGTKHKGETLIVLARTKTLSSSRTHISMHVWFINCEKEASILHFRGPGANFDNAHHDLQLTRSSMTHEASCAKPEWFNDCHSHVNDISILRVFNEVTRSVNYVKVHSRSSIV